jgi:hypothetical protein
VEIKNGDEIMLLKEGEQVPKKDEIGFIYSLLVDSSKPKIQNSDSKMVVEDEETKKRKLEEITKAKEEQEKE